ncbi:pimeloyl-ACP methyl esterase BioG family protein [Roseovarius sp. EL26]|uniref:pimeloyl-ACP methyl esterase BioG family protein n=1 Tax=Roseovarius sp. EL26 TaxID=2126672 RepID=UPI000EA1BF84|nr:pimeloyl-ACP methyl esterase BioG family protein [Roseovarius sp. EL26]
MRHHWLSHTGTSDLILVFGGWALGVAPFQGLSGSDDILFVEDYTKLDDPLPDLAGYDHVTLLAYSFGVASAAHWLAQSGAEPDKLVAVAGTLYPADSSLGIAPETVRATADGLTDVSFARFCRRAGVTGQAPAINLTAAQAELHAIADRGAAPDRQFDRIWIPDRDRIIPTDAQIAAWQGQGDVVRHTDGPHVPFGAGQNWAEWLI